MTKNDYIKVPALSDSKWCSVSDHGKHQRTQSREASETEKGVKRRLEPAPDWCRGHTWISTTLLRDSQVQDVWTDDGSLTERRVLWKAPRHRRRPFSRCRHRTNQDEIRGDCENCEVRGEVREDGDRKRTGPRIRPNTWTRIENQTEEGGPICHSSSTNRHRLGRPGNATVDESISCAQPTRIDAQERAVRMHDHRDNKTFHVVFDGNTKQQETCGRHLNHVTAGRRANQVTVCHG